MRNWLISIAITVLVTGSFSELLAQKQLPFGFNPVRKNKDFIVCSFELKANLIILKTTIDNSDTLNFVLDSGVQSIVILDSTLKYKINTAIGRTITITGLGEAPPFTAFVSVGHTIKIGDIIGYNQNIVLLNEDLLSLSEFVGLPIHGILGSDIFYRFNIRIDYAKHQLVFSDPARYKYKKRKGKRLDLHIERSKPYITINKLTVGKHSADNLNLVIDTGGAHALLLNKENLSENLIPESLVDGNLGRGLNGKIEGRLGRISHFRFGGHDFKDIVAIFPDTLAIGNKNIRDELLRQGSVGGEILKRFVVNINYHQKLIVLKPLKSQLKKPFENDMSGLDIRAIGDNYEQFEVVHVIQGSVAYQAGLRAGDKIITFNRKIARNLTINDIYEELSRKEGHQINLIILRENQLAEMNFRLKKII